LDPSNDAEYEKARARAERVATDLMDCITVFDKKGPRLTVFEWDLDALRKRGYRVSYQEGILTLRTLRKRWDVYLFSLGESFKPELKKETDSLQIKVRPFPPEPDPTVIIDHGEYMVHMVEDHEVPWVWYLDPRLPPGYYPDLFGCIGEAEFKTDTKRKMSAYHE
jgi:hypothetical protein